MEVHKMCAVCCVPFSEVKFGREDTHSVSVQKLNALFLQGVEGEEELSFANCKEVACVSCLNWISSAVEGRRNVSGVEESVRQAQVEILRLKRNLVKMLGQLEEALGSFKSARTGLSDILEESRARVGMLDEFYGELELGEELLQDALQFRNRIVNVMQELYTFTLDVPANSEPEVEALLLRSTEASDDDDQLISCPSPDSSEGEAELEPPPPPKRRQQVVTQPGRCVKQPVRYHQPPMDTQDAPSNVTCEKAEATAEVDQSTSAPGPPPAKRKKVFRNPVGQRRVYVKGVEWEDLDLNKNWTATQIERRRSKKLRSILAQVDFTGMTPYKSNIIRCVVRQMVRKEKIEGTSVCPAFDAIDPLKTHKLTYDPNTDKLLMGGMRISINEEQKCFECCECSELVPDQHGKHLPSIWNHVLGVHLNLFQCPKCPSKPSDYYNFRRHVLDHEGLIQFPCDICGKPRNSTRKLLEMHRMTHMSPEEKAEAIRNGAQDLARLRYLKRKRKAAGSFICATCGKGFRDKSKLSRHELIHQDLSFACPHCGLKLKSKHSVKPHVKFHCPAVKTPEERRKEYQFQCELCSKTYPTLTYLNCHKGTVHSETRPRPFQCDECKATYRTEKDLSRHLTTHSEERPFQCGECKWRSKTERQLKIHAKRHSGERPFACPKCGVGFKTPQSRGRHEKICDASGTETN